MAKQISLIKNIDIDYFALKGKESLVITRKTRYRGGNCRTIKGKDTRYKLYWSGNDKGTAGVGVFVAEEWIEKVFEVQSLRQNHFSETHSRPACGYLLSVYAPQSSGEFPCAVCRTGVGSNSIFCNGCKHWVHKKCSGLKRLKKDPDYRCTRCQGSVCPLDGRPQKAVQGGPDKLEVVASFCYLGDMLSAAECCELSTTTCVKSAWKKFKDLLPVLSSYHLSFKTRGRVYSSCVRSAMLHASET